MTLREFFFLLSPPIQKLKSRILLAPWMDQRRMLHTEVGCEVPWRNAEAVPCKAFMGAESHWCMLGTGCWHRESVPLGLSAPRASQYGCFCGEMQLHMRKVFELTADILILVHFHSGAGITLKYWNPPYWSFCTSADIVTLLQHLFTSL